MISVRMKKKVMMKPMRRKMESGTLIDLLVRHLAMEKKTTRMIATMICLYSDYKVVNILYFSSTVPPLHYMVLRSPFILSRNTIR